MQDKTSQKTFILTPRAYVRPFLYCFLLYHLPVILWSQFIISSTTTNNNNSECRLWLRATQVLHLVATVLSISLASYTLLSAVSKKPTALFSTGVCTMFILHVADFGWAIFGQIKLRKYTTDIDTLLRVNIGLSTTHVFFWLVFTLAFGPIIHSTASVATSTWAHKLKKLYKFLSCHQWCKSMEKTYDADIHYVFEDVGQLFAQLLTREFHDGRFASVEISDVLLSLSLVKKPNSSSSTTSSCLNNDTSSTIPSPQVIRDLQHYGNLSNGIYGWRNYLWYHPFKFYRLFCCGTGRLPRTKGDTIFSSNQRGFLSHMMMKSSHKLVYLNGNNAMFQSPYGILHNAETNEWTITIRGSLSMEDAFVDTLASGHALDGDTTLFPKGSYVHKGIYQTAYALFNHLQTGRRKELFYDKFKNSSTSSTLTLCGHSLGGGIATVLNLLLVTKGGLSSSSVRTFAFGSPPVFSAALSKWAEPYVTSVVYNDDIVPRLSMTSAVQLREEMTSAYESVADVPLYKVWWFGTSTSNPVIDEEKAAYKSYNFNLPLTIESDLFLAGKVLHVETLHEARSCSCYHVRGQQELVITRKDKEEFTRIKVTDRMLMDHMPHHYDRVFQYL